MPNRRQLNQALEKSTLMILGTADEYKNYLDHEYESNYIARKANWDRHYEEMRTAYRGHLFSVTGRGMPLKDMNIAILGPGLRPVGRDLGLTEQRVVLPEVNSVVIGDFSAWVVSEAYKQLHDEVNLRGTPVYPMQIDLTDMGSTAYSNMIRRLLDPLQDEDALEDVSKQLGSLTIDQLQMALDNERVQMVEKSVKIIDELRGRMAVPECFREGGINQYHSFALSVGPQREPLPIHSWYIPMVLAGTGAAAEHKIWETFDAVTCDPNRGARVDSEETFEARRSMYRNFYQLIANYNTLIARKIVADILRDNPETRILAVTDVNTCLYRYRTGVLDRLHVGKLGSDLSGVGIEMTRLQNEWEWHDEEPHHHGVVALQFRKMAQKREQPNRLSINEELQLLLTAEQPEPPPACLDEVQEIANDVPGQS